MFYYIIYSNCEILKLFLIFYIYHIYIARKSLDNVNKSGILIVMYSSSEVFSVEIE